MGSVTGGLQKMTLQFLPLRDCEFCVPKEVSARGEDRISIPWRLERKSTVFFGFSKSEFKNIPCNYVNIIVVISPFWRTEQYALHNFLFFGFVVIFAGFNNFT